MELNKPEWEKEAETLSELQEGTYTSQHKITYTHGFVDGSQSMLTAVEKMLKKEIAERTQAMSKLSNRVSIRAQITTLNKLLEELKSIQP